MSVFITSLKTRFSLRGMSLTPGHLPNNRSENEHLNLRKIIRIFSPKYHMQVSNFKLHDVISLIYNETGLSPFQD